jgi:hypothetical protein
MWKKQRALFTVKVRFTVVKNEQAREILSFYGIIEFKKQSAKKQSQ